MYTCGPTVYDCAHVGNFRAFLTYDVLKRVLLYLGYDVHHVCNLTDVDDKIIRRCEERNLTLTELTREYERLFFDDLKALNIVPATNYPRATEHIEDMARFILDLESNGLAYRSEEGSWYFNVEKKEGYGSRLVQLDPESMKKTGTAGSRRGGVDADEYDSDKEGIRDFCLWRTNPISIERIPLGTQSLQWKTVPRGALEKDGPGGIWNAAPWHDDTWEIPLIYTPAG